LARPSSSMCRSPIARYRRPRISSLMGSSSPRPRCSRRPAHAQGISKARSCCMSLPPRARGKGL
jgi:hypothetical protein